MNLFGLREFLRKKREEGPAKCFTPGTASFSVEAEVHRTEELRTTVLGAPSEDEIRLDRPHDPWRPARTLGKLPRT